MKISTTHPNSLALRKRTLKGSRLLQVLMAAFGIGIGMLAYAGQLDSGFISLSTVILSAFLCVFVARNRALLLVSAIMLYACYSIFYVNYCSPLLTTMYTVYRGLPEARIALASLVLFLAVLILFLPDKVHTYGKGSPVFINRARNDLIFIGLAIVLVLILIFGFARPDSLGGDRGSPSTFYEYAVIPFILAFYFAGDSRIANAILCFLVACFALQNIIYGGRIMALQYLLIVFFVLISARISTITYISILICGIILFTFFGAVRTGVSEADIKDFIDALSTSVDHGFAWDTAYSSWHTSITFILYKETLGISDVLSLIGSFFLSICLGGSVPGSQLSNLTRSQFFHNYGGILPVYFEFYFGAMGVILIAIFVAIIYRYIDKSLAFNTSCRVGAWSATASCCALYITVTSFRWILYSPSQITRGLLLCFLACSFCIWFDSEMKARRR